MMVVLGRSYRHIPTVPLRRVDTDGFVARSLYRSLGRGVGMIEYDALPPSGLGHSAAGSSASVITLGANRFTAMYCISGR